MYKQQAKGATECRKIGDCTEGETKGERRRRIINKNEIFIYFAIAQILIVVTKSSITKFNTSFQMAVSAIFENIPN